MPYDRFINNALREARYNTQQELNAAVKFETGLKCFGSGYVLGFVDRPDILTYHVAYERIMESQYLKYLEFETLRNFDKLEKFKADLEYNGRPLVRLKNWFSSLFFGELDEGI